MSVLRQTFFWCMITAALGLWAACPAATAETAHPNTLASWTDSVRRQVFAAVRSASAQPAGAGTAQISFVVDGEGRISGIAAQGAPDAGAQAMAALRRIDHVPPPPDHRPHKVTFRFKRN